MAGGREVLHEGLLIVGCVAMWRPLEVLLQRGVVFQIEGTAERASSVNVSNNAALTGAE